MPMNILNTQVPTVGELEEMIRREKLDGDQAQAMRIDHQRQVFRLQSEAARLKYPGTNATVGNAVSAAMNAANTGLLNLPRLGASLAMTPIEMARRGIGPVDAFGLARENTKMMLGDSPAGAAVGTIAGVLAPTPANAVARAGFGAVGGTRLAQLASTSANPVLAAGAQILSAIVGGAGATAALEGTSSLVGGEGPIDSATRAVSAASNPTGIAFSAGLGGVAAAARVATDPATRALIERARRIIPGYMPTPDQLRNTVGGGFLVDMLESLGRSPAGRNAVSRYMRERFYDPLRTSIDAIRGRVGSTVNDMGNASDTMRRLVPTPESPGLVNTTIRSIGRRAFQTEGGPGSTVVGRDILARIVNNVRGLNAAATRVGNTEGPRGDAMRGVIGDLRRVITEASRGRGNVTVQMLDNIRQRLGELSQFSDEYGSARINNLNLSARDVREARTLYHAIRAAEAAASPQVDRALTSISTLRGFAERLRPVANDATSLDNDVRTVTQIFGARDFSRRWEELTSRLPERRVQALRGAYLSLFFQHVMDVRTLGATAQEVPNLRRLQAAWNGTSMFRGQVFESVLPGIREDLNTLGQVADLVNKSVGRAEGSATARRLEDAALLGGVVDTLGMASQLLTEPGVAAKALGRLLGMVGTHRFVESLILPDGAIASRLNRLALGQPVYPGRLGPAAFNELGNLGGVGAAAQGIGQSGIEAMASGISAAKGGYDAVEKFNEKRKSVTGGTR